MFGYGVMGMTRSDNPFEDLPEWKERRRLQEAQAAQHNGAQAGAYPEPLQPGYAQPQGQYPTDQAGYAPVSYDTSGRLQEPQRGHPARDTRSAYQSDPRTHGDPNYTGSQQPAGQTLDEYGQPIAASARPDPRTAQYYDDQRQYDAGAYGTGQAVPGAPAYDTGGLAAYPDHGGDQSPPGYGDQNQAGQGDQSGAGYAEQDVPGFVQQDARYNDPNGYRGDAQLGPMPSGQDTGFDLNHYAPGHQANDFSSEFAPGHDPAYIGHDAQGDQLTPLQGNAVGDGQPDDDEYYEDDDEGRGFSWKLAAAVIVTGAVVTGGGIVLYDSFKGGGLTSSGSAPVIKAHQGPAKTVPTDAGGRQFSNRDSKLLGRLDKSGGATTAKRLSDANNSDSRVRTVPTVRIGRDGRLLLPKAPQVASAPAATSTASGAADNGTATPGINIVNSLSERSGAGLGGLPPVVPKAAASTAAETRAPTVRSSAQAPVIKNRPAGNLAITQSKTPPPVPSRSTYASASRANGAQSAPAVVAPRTARVAPPAGTASTLGAGSVARSASRGFVAVLATAPSRMTALKSFAELQQKHPVALQNRVPDLQKVDLKARGLGIMYRVVVGPASSRGAANSVCDKLKSEGYKGCWVKTN